MPEYMTDAKYGTAEQIMALPVARLVALVSDAGASEYAKAKACQRLAVIGDGASAATVAKLLDDEKLNVYARSALEQIPGPAAGEALMASLGRLKGRALVGVINSLGVRRETRAIAALTALRSNADVTVARAADAALARIRPGL